MVGVAVGWEARWAGRWAALGIEVVEVEVEVVVAGRWAEVEEAAEAD
jgi:hypothetical protein